jgi:hypothetical protein
MSSPVLVFDGLDESVDPPQLAAGIEELSLALHGWKLVVSSRPGSVQLRRFSKFRVIELQGISQNDATALLREYARGLPEGVIARIAEAAGGNPLLLRLMARDLQRQGPLGAATDTSSLEGMLGHMLNEAIRASSDPEKLSELLEELALAGGRDRIEALASKSRITEKQAWSLLDAPRTRPLLVLNNTAGTAAFFHAAVRDVILTKLVLASRFRLVDLQFGSEAAEKDELLEESFVPRRGMDAILDQRRSIIIGDRGSGKSAIFRRLTAPASAADGHQRVEICPVTNAGDLLQRVVDEGAWLDADALLAGWLVVVASLVASTVPASAPRKLRRDAAGLRAAFGFPTRRAGALRRAARAVSRLLGGTTLRFAVGPVNLEAQLPSGSGTVSKASVDVESFLHEADGLLRESGRRVVVMLDRIDEIYKYKRDRQETAVQALLQAEARVSLLKCIGLAVFLRTDLFELYDIQEKNKLVSRTLNLVWSDDEWLQVLVRRVLVNEPFRRLAKRLRDVDGNIETRSALEVLFPPEIEGQPVDRWLVDSLRNGNGDISPRLAVLLLHLARDQSARPEETVTTLPIFSAEATGKAMTRLSYLSFWEVVKDFKVAPSFVQNCKAGKLDNFALSEVENLFEAAEGGISEQVSLLERLGFLERVVQQSDSGIKSLFRIPKLYTRFWDHA